MNRNITATILIIVAIGIYVTISRGIIANAGTIKAVNNQYSSAIASAEQLISVRDQVLKEYNSISPNDLSRLDEMIPSTVDNIRLIIDLNNMALQDGISLQNIKAAAAASDQSGTAAPAPAPAAPGSTGSSVSPLSVPTLGTVDVSFSLTAPYSQFISFMQNLESNLRIMDVTQLSMTANDSGAYTFNVGLQTYWLQQ